MSMSAFCSSSAILADQFTIDLLSSSSTAYPIPHAVIREQKTYYTICFHPDIAGVIPTSPKATPKSALAPAYPEVVKAWDTKVKERLDEEHRIRQIQDSILDDAGKLKAQKPVRERDPGVACDQNLLPGMRAHWGELRQCATHLREGNAFEVCKGCRVAHHAQHDRNFDRTLMMTRGARVPVCEGYARMALNNMGMRSRACVCDRQWTCYGCRESELEHLANARHDAYVEGSCSTMAKGDIERDEDIKLF
ncbi:predicted protein [Pyrenophora tritici-repentis Pt-1C-BFP]|uniref:Uncharacterized protein n=1 Tax=Pyrenophora tritici-repentis (strain Pt-1C-BFP) TaxID=426418 RepID=B2VXV9_PYRTR|nr:uncharacterized protein PTRG_03355 [Pyrenophora tritici-repentis Pt-1C-BFP]EDU45878.1 predicted protein [Pyrenophora tritici-repentis Pt-1C-BFP]